MLVVTDLLWCPGKQIYRAKSDQPVCVTSPVNLKVKIILVVIKFVCLGLEHQTKENFPDTEGLELFLTHDSWKMWI